MREDKQLIRRRCGEEEKTGEDKSYSSFIKYVPQKQVNKQIHKIMAKGDMAYEENIPSCKYGESTSGGWSERVSVR